MQRFSARTIKYKYLQKQNHSLSEKVQRHNCNYVNLLKYSGFLRVKIWNNKLMALPKSIRTIRTTTRIPMKQTFLLNQSSAWKRTWNKGTGNESGNFFPEEKYVTLYMRCDNLDRGTLFGKIYPHILGLFPITVSSLCLNVTLWHLSLNFFISKKWGEEGVFGLYFALFPDVILPCHQSFCSTYYIIFYHKKPTKTNEDKS